jgi:Zn-dependent peptidase ImmA (M78 family)
VQEAEMKLLRDPLGRPIPRLYFKVDELDRECEQIVTNFMDRHSAGFSLPVPTDDIIRMIEMEADDLDMYADLPEELDGYTDFFFERKPRVRIAKRLSDPRYENRLRMTLGHEFGHVRFHAPLWRDGGVERDRRPAEPCWTCNRDTIVAAPENDWMEWQAAYIGGALLMPREPVRLLVRGIGVPQAPETAVGADSDLGQAAILRVTKGCQVSQQAARVRLAKLGLLSQT